MRSKRGASCTGPERCLSADHTLQNGPTLLTGAAAREELQGMAVEDLWGMEGIAAYGGTRRCD